MQGKMKSLATFLRSSPRGTQSALARALNVRPSTVLRWADGSIRIDEGRALKIRRAVEAEQAIHDIISRLRGGKSKKKYRA